MEDKIKNLMSQGYSRPQATIMCKAMKQYGGKMQEQAPQDQMQQIVQQVTQALQSGADPQEIMQQLVQMGVPQADSQGLIQQVMQQMQAPQEGQMQMAQMGGMTNGYDNAQTPWANTAYDAQQASLNPFTQNLNLSDMSQEEYIPNAEMQNRMRQNRQINSQLIYNENTGMYEGNYDEDGNAKQYNYTNRLQLYNPYGGVGLDQSLYYAGQGFGEGNAAKAAVGTGLSLLKVARGFMSGFSTAKASKSAEQDMYNRQFGNNTRPEYLGQEGGKIKTAEMMTGRYITDNPQGGNVNIESDEYVKHMDTGEIQKAIGETHKNGGIDVKLENAKILSDYTKIGAKTAQELRKQYDISVKAKYTFASVMDKYNKKIGITKTTEEQADIIEKLGENNSVKQEATKALNEQVLAKQIEEKEQKLAELKPKADEVFENLFSRQEMIPKKGDGTQILDKNGKPIEVKDSAVAQQGGYINEMANKYGISPERAMELMQEGGMSQEQAPQEGQQQQIMQMVAQALQAGTPPEQIAQALIEMGIPQEQVMQIIQQVAQEMQGQEQHQMPDGRMMDGATHEEQMAQEQAPQEGQQQQIMQMVAQALQAGTPPEQIAQALIEMGIPQEQVMQIIQQVAQEMQGQEQHQMPDGRMMDGATHEEQMAQEGGKIYAQEGVIDARLKDYYKQLQDLGYEGKLQIGDMQNWVKDNYPNEVEKYFTESGQPLNAKHMDLLKKDYPWVFKHAGISPKIESASYTTEEKDKLFSIVKGAGNGEDGIKEGEFKSFVLNGFTDNKWAWRFPTISPKVNGTSPVTSGNKITASTIPIQAEAQVQNTDSNNLNPDSKRDAVKKVFPNLPVDFILPPSAMQTPYKAEISLGKLSPVKMTPEAQLVEAERQRKQGANSLAAANLSPQVQEALMAQQLGNTQLASNDAIGKVEQFNADNQFKVDQFNLGQRTKEDLSNEQFNLNYEQKVAQTQSNQERDMRRYFNQLNMNQRRDFRDVNDINLTNAMFEQFQSDGSSIWFMNNKASDIGKTYLTTEQMEKIYRGKK